jgi:hypothetical protein
VAYKVLETPTCGMYGVDSVYSMFVIVAQTYWVNKKYFMMENCTSTNKLNETVQVQINFSVFQQLSFLKLIIIAYKN